MPTRLRDVVCPFTMKVRVYWEDTDAGGVVYHAGYVRFLERARTEWLRSLGIGQEQLRGDHDRVFAVRWMEMDFLKPARLDDELEVGLRVAAARHASMLFEQVVRRGGEVLLTARVKAVSLTASEFKPCALSPELLATFKVPEYDPR